MKLNIKTKDIELSDSLSAYVNSKIVVLDKLLYQYNKENSLLVDLELARITKHHQKGNVYMVVANVEFGGNIIRADYTGEDLYKGINTVKQTLKREVGKFKELQKV
ncbi:MAG: ribosomal subunit interface protein [Candidatus Liptonbacteria bacterium CG11_big_fil_rev_8_21_14_0_20_35_14]|uniref:Ribosomal subunit interface protein n=1 Tax=Candidatus Liptonbacteria bacterium CG11_big_fil_rev_8_21_14_0_20_35_14 TaxID=1974634 RepID=A0A2H0N7L3_9BACT|nr:MAG: ribosomal subunit interface protein [Candidatus Liptonbacteria bacterium CG11_big_fil_rev_8_21_14_0_20_35_14]